MTHKNWLVPVFAVLAFVQTLAYCVYLRDDPGNYNGAGAGGDQVAYIDLAQQILHGTWAGAVHYMPGLPVVIAAGQVITGDPRLGIALIQGVLYALLVIFAARLARRAFGERAAVWSAAGVGLNPALGYYAAQALTEFLTAAALLALVGAIFAWSRQARLSTIALAGLLIAAAAFLRAEYLGLAVIFALIVVWLGRPRRAALTHALVLVAVTALAMTPWVVRYAVATGTPALYNESPFSNLVLMGTWFRVFDEPTFAQLQQIETAPGPREQAIARAQTVGPRPELSQRYMEQSRGPYERPLPETLGLAAENIRLNLRQYLVNHFVLAPVLIWAGHTPVRQADAPRLPASARYVIWGAELVLLLLALWQAVRGLWDHDTLALSLGFLGVVLFLTVVHVLIAVDDRFTTPALPLVGLFAGARIAQLLGTRARVAVGYAA
ncbi:MAG TPA: glycosyltransferase family 39 protein [Chloroflexota bacterium]|nr:glycosyltransferase family 39 protein [Chloroflexota bacterium]